MQCLSQQAKVTQCVSKCEDVFNMNVQELEGTNCTVWPKKKMNRIDSDFIQSHYSPIEEEEKKL